MYKAKYLQENSREYLLLIIEKKQPPEVFCKKRCRSVTLLKNRLWHRCFPVNFAKFLRTPFSQNNSGRLLLSGVSEPAVCRSSTKQVLLNNSQNSQENTYIRVTFLRTPWFTEHLQSLLLKVSAFQPATSL